MSEEEKKAIKELKEIKELVEEDLKNEKYEVTATLDRIDLKSLVIVLNLVETLEGKIRTLQYWVEELKKEKRDNIRVVYGGRRFGTERMVVKDYISKDKIRERIEEARKIRWHIPKLVIEYFEEFLEEN